MPNLEEQKRFRVRKSDTDTNSRTSSEKGATPKQKKPSSSLVDDDDDEVISESIKETSGGRVPTSIFILGGVGVVVIVILIFLLFSGSKQATTPQTVSSSGIQQGQSDAVSTQPAVPSASAPPIGTQDFTQNTNMSNNGVLTDPAEFVKDIYGLSTRVDYTVSEIMEISDFVSYTKHRGTFGGGLEIYWLDATYKETNYVIQVPFKYYKELDDTGIVPVKMEVLRVPSGTDTLTIVSYMCLDEKTLQTVLKSQS